MKFAINTISVICFLFLFILDGYSQTVDYPRNIEWNKAGAVTPFPDIAEFDRIIHVLPPSNDNDWQLLQAAIDSAGASNGINLVLLSEGTYLLGRPLILEAGTHDNVYIKGAGPNHLMHSGPSTILAFDFTNPVNFRIPVYGNINSAIALKGGDETYLGAISDYNSATNQIIVPGNDIEITTGDLIRVRSNKDDISCKEHPCLGQINRIKNVISHSPLVLELEHDFSLSWDQQNTYGGINLNVHKIDALKNVGISSLGLETIGYNPDPLPDHFVCKDEPAANRSPHGHHIFAFRVYNANLQDLYSYRPVANHIYMIESLHNTVSESFFDGAIYRHGCFGGHGYGVNLWRKNTLNLVENNIFRRLRRSLMFGRGVHKNVIGYNYSREVAAQTGSPIRGDLSSRNMSDSGNLAEGNVLDRILNDTYHERTYTAFKNVYFRNSTYYNYIENEGGIENYFIGNQGEFKGNHDSLSIKADLYAYVDSATSTHKNSSSGVFNPDFLLNKTSLYHKEIPAFIYQKDTWNLNYTWPPIGPGLNHSDPSLTQDIPARGRYCEAYNDFPNSAYHCEGSPSIPLPASLMKPASVEN